MSTANKKQAIISAKDFNLIIRVAKSNWWVPVIVLPIFYVLGTFYVYRLINIYKASTEFLLKSNDTYYQNNVVTDANFYSYGGYVDNLNEQRILQSYDLASQAVDKLIDKIQVSYFIVGKVRTTEQFNAMPFKIDVAWVKPHLYEQILDFKIIDFDNYEITYTTGNIKQTKKGVFNHDLIDLDLKINIERQESFSPKTVNSLKNIFYQFSVHSRDFLISNIRSNLKITNPEYTNILKVDLLDVIPERAVLILDTLNSVYAMSKLKTKYELNDRTITYIDRQLNEITFTLKNYEDTMQNYKERKSIINLDWEQNDFLSKISAYDAQKSQLQLQQSALNDLEKYIIEDKDPQFLPPSVFIIEKTGFMNTAVTELYNKQIELNRLYGIAKPGNPSILDTKQQLNKLKQDLLVYLNNTRKSTVKQIENVEKEILDYIGQARLIPSKQRELLNIQRKAAVNEQLYNFLLEKKASTKIARASIISDVKIIESPRNAGVESPDKNAIQKRFITFGLLVVTLIIFIRAFFFSKIKTIEHLKELTTLPIIGVLPLVKKTDGEGIIIEQSPNSMIAEAFRNFRTNLQYAGVDKPAKTYLVTSFLPGEGKTFITVNLAAMLAKSGKKTIILELDLHKPRVYKRFGLNPQTRGITTYVTGQSNYSEIISKTNIENLYCMYSGPIPPNPSELVLSEKMKELINKAKEDFDYVIIDTPPAGLLSDSLFLIQQVDASIFVLNTKTSSRKVISFIKEVVETNNISNIMLLLNGISNQGRRYYYQGYGYSYGYGYGYGYGKGLSSKK